MKSILVALDDSLSSQAVIDYLLSFPLRREEVKIVLLHVYIESAYGDGLMQERFIQEQPARLSKFLDKARDTLVAHDFPAENVTTLLVRGQFASAPDGIIDQFQKSSYDMVIIGRKKKTKAEEFLLGDVSIKLVRELNDTAVVVIKPD